MALQTVDRSPWHRFATAYARALHAAGAPSPTVEDEVTRVLRARGIEATVMATPTALWVDVDGSQVVRLTPGETDLGRQVALSALGDRVGAGLAPEAALDELARPGRGPWRPADELVAYLGVSVGAALALGGSINDALAAGAVGALVASLHRRASRSSWGRLADGLAAFAAAGAGQLAGVVGAEPARVALASVVVLAPGLALTTSAAEVAAGHWASGTARASGAVNALIQLGAGLAVAAAVVPRAPAALAVTSAPDALGALAQLAIPVAVAVLGRTRPVDLAPAAAVAWAVSLVARVVGGPTGALVGAALASAGGHAVGRWRGVPATVFQTPALFLLVPGSLGVEVLRRAIGGDQGQLAAAWSVAAVVVALAAGLLVGNAAMAPPAGSGRRPSPVG
jgi:uncharacterized membrane protein YjjP (DUF1212 family)